MNCDLAGLRLKIAAFAVFGIAVVVLNCVAPATACDTPVYRYAMYRWEPTPYEVYHFHAGEMDAAFAAASEKLADARHDKSAPANVAVYPVNLAKEAEVKTVPPDVRRLWEKKVEQGAKTPATVIVNPLGFEVHTGDLAADDVAGLLQSPLRSEVGELLGKGHCGVYVLLLGTDARLNKAASEAVDKLIKDVNSGDLALYAGPDAYNPLSPKTASAQVSQDDKEDASKDKAEKTTKPPHSAVALKFTQKQLKAQDPWFYRSLMAVENDLYEFQDEPMLFVIYGRGRALPPYIGKGIVYDNLVEVTDFITSACSCTVKDQNPGVDLLMAYDWQSASAAVAEKFGAEEGNNESVTDLFPQLIVPGSVDDIAEPQPEADKPNE